MDKVYDKDQVRSVIEEIGVRIVSQTYSDFLCYCPVHSNSDSPAFTIGINNGLFMCHNPTCKASSGGTLVQLVSMLSGRDPIKANRMIEMKRFSERAPLIDSIDSMDSSGEIPEVDISKLNGLESNLWSSPGAIAYLQSRGFSDNTIKQFRCGYDPKNDMIVIPIFDKDGRLIGFNGRSISKKVFKLSKMLPRNQIIFNIHEAKRHGGTVIVCESQFDVMKLYESGYPNGVCFFGSHISRQQAKMLQRYCDRVIIMTDSDGPGRKAGHSLSAMLAGTKVEWAIYDWGVIYPNGAKDICDMTVGEVKHCVKNAVSDVAYKSFRPLAATR